MSVRAALAPLAGTRWSRRPIAVSIGEGELAGALGLLTAALFCLWELGNAAAFTFAPSYGSDSDEGVYLLSAQLLLRGYALFQHVFSSQPVLFLPSLAAAVRLVGNPTVGGHVYETLWGLATLGGVFWMGWTAYRPLAGAVAAVLLAVTPGFLLYAHTVVSETPMLGLCALAVAAAQSYYLSGRRRMAALSGVLLMASTEMKLLSALVVMPLALLLLSGGRRWRRAGRSLRALGADAAAWGLCFAVPIAGLLAVAAPQQQIQQVVAFHLAASRALPWEAAQNWDHLGGFLWRYDPGLLGLAIAGAALGLFSARRRFLPLVYSLWFLSSVVALLGYHPLAQHQFMPLLPPLALLALLGSAVASGQLSVVRRNAASLATGYRLLATVVYLALLCLRTFPLDNNLFAPVAMPRRAPLIALLARTTRPESFVVCDDPLVALGAHRLVPPGLDDVSVVRTAAGYLAAEQAIALTERYRPAAIVLSHPPQAQLPAAYVGWVQRHYRQIPSPVPGAQVYLSEG